MQRRFKVVLTWDNETQVYVVTVPALPGCVTQGKNRGGCLGADAGSHHGPY
jgi:predicted RNase H-like HicB family nuclease